jgi:hypothetical protein
MKLNLLVLITSIFLFSFAPQDDDKYSKLGKITKDDNSHYTNVGNIGITVTNFGTIGHGFGKWPQQPSCEYPIGSGIEHLFDGGLWIGGYLSNDENGSGRSGPFVTTGAVDASSVSNRGGGFEYTNSATSTVKERSSLIDSKFFSPTAISHQDLNMNFTDTNRYFIDNKELIVDHVPLGLVINQQCYAWNYPFADFFVIFNYWIKNTSKKYIDSVYVGLWNDTVVRNTNITSPRTGAPFYNKGGNGFNDSLKIAYEFDATGDVGFTDSYLGIQFLGSSILQDKAQFLTWQFRNTTDAKYFAPQNDVQRYKKMTGYFSEGIVFNEAIANDIKAPSNRSILITAGPYTSIAPGDSINVVFAYVAAKKSGFDDPALDTKVQKENLYNNAGWAIRAYNGEDRNGNNILDIGEDLDGNGKITRYILPAPPLSPTIKVVPESEKVTIYWDKRAENSIDPISAKKDFEGYRIYRTNVGFDLTASQDIMKSLTLAAEFDSTDNKIGFNSGFDFVELDEAKIFPDDLTEYWYKFEFENLLNGWQYLYSVTAFDEGDDANNLGSLESSSLAGVNRVLPGTPSTSDDDVKIGVYPNPYYGSAIWDGGLERLRKIYFFNLPEECEITIYTLSGDIVKKIHHNQESNGSNVRWFETFASDGKQKMSGGEEPWDLVSDHDQAIATGLYLFSVKDYSNDNIKVGKFLVIK